MEMKKIVNRFNRLKYNPKLACQYGKWNTDGIYL